MSCCKLVLFAAFLLISGLGLLLYFVCLIPSPPELDRNAYWGPGEPPSHLNSDVNKFKIIFSEKMIEDLRDRLNRTRYTPGLEGVAFNYGFNQPSIKPLVEYWKTKYDFEARQNYLNKFPQYTTNIQGLKIHFIRVKPTLSKNIKVLPMLMLHGWPGSVVEFYKIIPMLTEPKPGQDFVFELVIPSLPGFGYSQGASKPGLGAAEMGIIMSNLMKRLGHEKYYIQGGDWGGIITSSMATLLPQEILGFHTNFPYVSMPKGNILMFLGSLWPSLVIDEKYEGKFYPLSKRLHNMVLETGYFHIQATKPDTVGMAVGDSPAGLAVYLLEKFSMATNMNWKDLDDGGLTKAFSYDELIDNIMMYWATNSATTAFRIYAESYNYKQFALKYDKIPTLVPTAAARFPHEVTYSTDYQLREKYHNLVQATDLPKGGHFAALEVPEILAEDIISAVRKMEAFNAKKQAKEEL